MEIQDLSREQLQERLAALTEKYNEYKSMGLKLDMSRGKPGADQLEITNDMLDPAFLGDYKASNGFDVRNYGILDGIPECKKLFSEILDVAPENLIVFGNASLTIMYDYIAQCMIFGAGAEPWAAQKGIKFLCPVPGYDRHFKVTELFGIEMINIPMTATGPDMDMIEKLVAEDDSIKGIWCVPQYSNPDGVVYSDETVKRFAALRPKAPDFRIFWDNAYCVHHLTDKPTLILNILEEAKKVGNEDIVYIFGSTSKITFAGAGVAVMGGSRANIDELKKYLGISIISYNNIS